MYIFFQNQCLMTVFVIVAFSVFFSCVNFDCDYCLVLVTRYNICSKNFHVSTLVVSWDLNYVNI